MRLTGLEQYARGVAHPDEAEDARLRRTLERIKWWLWHGNQHRACQHADDLRDDVDALELDYPHLGRFGRSAHEFAAYLAANRGSWSTTASGSARARLVRHGGEHGLDFAHFTGL
jgi:hypothetical protein